MTTRREKLARIAEAHARVGTEHAQAVETQADGEDSAHHVDLGDSLLPDADYFPEIAAILSEPDPLTAAGSNPIPALPVSPGLTLSADDPAEDAMFHMEVDHPDCDGQIAVVNDDDGSLEGCYPAEAEAAARLDELNGGAPPPAEGEAQMAAGRPKDAEWTGLLVIEGLASGDGRLIDPGALSWRNLPLPLMMQTKNPEGQSDPHAGAELCGSIVHIEREDDTKIRGWGKFDIGPAGREAKRLYEASMLRGVSVDLDMAAMEYRAGDGSPVNFEEMDPLEMLMGNPGEIQAVTDGRIMGATLTPFPAFQEAQLEALVASGGDHPAIWSMPIGHDLEALVASAAISEEIPASPPVEWFSAPDLSGPTPLRVSPEGRITGHVATWGSCHIGRRERCVSVPRSSDPAYRHFRTGQVLTAEGALVNTGPIYLDGGHAPLKLGAQGAKDWMAETGAAVADVAVYEDPHGIAVAGALRPAATPEQVRALRASDISPDWRSIKGNLEMVGLVSVNTSGFVVPALVASASWDLETDEPTALVAAGSVRRDALASMLNEIVNRVAAVEVFVNGERRQRALSRFQFAAPDAENAMEDAAPDEEMPEDATEIPCPNCGEQIPADSDVCPFCGFDLPDSLEVDEVKKTSEVTPGSEAKTPAPA